MSEPPHRKETVLKNRTKPTIPRNLVNGVSDKKFRIDVLELEVKLLNLNFLAAQAEALNKHYDSESDLESDPESGDDVRHVSNSLPDRETEKLNNKFDVKDFNVAIMNPGGLNSKRESILNAVHKWDIRALVVSETYAVGKEVPVLDSTMEAFYKNKSGGQNKGGVSIFLEKTLAKHSVVVGKSDHDHEWVAVKINYFNPPVVLIGLYGCQTSKNSVTQMKEKWKELWDFANQYKDIATVIIGGDANAAIGNKANLTNNCSSTNTNGNFLLKGVKSGSWKILNSLFKGDQRTHKDRSSDSFRCLDYVITNKRELCSRVFIDGDQVITPYRVMAVGPPSIRKYTDHVTVLCSFQLEKKAEVKVGPQPPIIVRNEEGDAKFHQATGEMAEEMLDNLNSGMTILNVLKIIMRKLKEAEKLSYLRIVITSIKRKMWGDNEAFMKLTKDLENKADRVMKCKTNDKIWTMRGQKLLRDRHEEVTSMYNNKGELIEDREGILEILTQYNQKLLGRVPHVPDFEEIHKMKKRVVDTLDDTKIEEFNTLTPREYVRAIQRIANKGKNMFKQFLKINPKMQALFFFVFKRMYEEEIVPDCFRTTTLISLYKKNDPKDPGNYRFLHMKSDLSRLYELLIYMKLESHFDTATAESQMGGRKDGDTIEHLAMLNSIIKDREEKGEGVILTMVDAIKCFDRSFLSDNHATLQLEGADKKALKVMYKLSKENTVKVAGSKDTFSQTDGVGQGSVGGARITTSAITESTERHVNKIPKQLALTHRQEEISQQGFVDDVILGGANTEGARVSTRLYSNTLYELAMSAHKTKSVQVIAGSKAWVERVETELKADPCLLQGFALKTTPCEKYLGMYYVSGSYRETIEKNIKVKCGLMQASAIGIRTMCDLPEIKRFGKAAAQKLLAQSQIYPLCLYGTQSWIQIEADQYKSLEDAFRSSLTTIMSVPKQTNYAALLKVNGLIHVEAFLDLVKLKCWNYKLYVKKSGRMYRVLLYEIVHKIKGGLAEDLSNLCRKYELRDLCKVELDPDIITRNCRQESYRRQWREHLTLKSIPMMITADKVRYTFYEYPDNLSRALIMKELGLLVLKTMQPHKFLERNMASPKDRSCLWAPLCTNSLDSLDHIRICPYYSTKYREDRDPVLAEAIFLDKISRERNRQFSQPMILFGSEHENDCYDEILDEPNIDADNNISDKILAGLARRSDPLTCRDKSQVNIVKQTVKTVSSLSSLCVGVIRESDPNLIPNNSTVIPHEWWKSHLATTPRVHVNGWARVVTQVKGKIQIPKSHKDFVSSVMRAIHVDSSKIRVTRLFSVKIMGKPWKGKGRGKGNSNPRRRQDEEEEVIETYNTDVSLGASSRFSRVSHKKKEIRYWKRASVIKSINDIQRESKLKDKSGRVTTVSLEVMRDFEEAIRDLEVKVNDKKAESNKIMKRNPDDDNSTMEVDMTIEESSQQFTNNENVDGEKEMEEDIPFILCPGPSTFTRCCSNPECKPRDGYFMPLVDMFDDTEDEIV